MKNKKNNILKGSIYIAVILELISACALDSESIIPMIVCLICAVYMLLIVVANTRG